jgi:hypothetical protein
MKRFVHTLHACIAAESSKHANMQDFAKAEVKMGKDLSTANLKSHLQHVHRDEYQEFIKKGSANTGTSQCLMCILMLRQMHDL